MVNWVVSIEFVLSCPFAIAGPKNKKADVAEHPEVFHHVGLLVNEPPGAAGLLLI